MKTSVNALLPCLVAAAVGATACVPRFYERSSVSLETTASDDDLSVRYGDFDGCLLKQQVPVEYTIRRPRYSLVAKPIAGLDAKPKLELLLQGSGLTLRFEGVDPVPAALYADHGSRYLVDTAELSAPVLDITVFRGEEQLGAEHFRFSPESCRILSPTG